MVYPITKLWLYLICRTLLGKINGIENVPKKVPFIIIANHEKPSLDAILIAYLMVWKLNRKVHFIAKTGWWFLGETICRQWAGCVPLLSPRQAYKEVKELVEAGEIVGFFPESDIKRTTSPKTGSVRLAIETNTPILPIAVKPSKIPFTSKISVGKITYVKKSKNINAQMKGLMNYIYKLRDEMG